MKVLFKPRINFFLILFVVLLATDFLALLLTKKAQEKLFSLKSQVSWEEKLKDEGFSLLLKEEKVKIDNLFPNEQGVIQLISAISRNKDQFENLSIAFNSEEPETKNNHKYFPFTLQVSGSRERIISFFKELLNTPLVLEITRMEINRTQNSTDGFFQANLFVKEIFD